MSTKIIILGGGLSGIYLGYRLKKEGFSIKILEANTRVGGRIYTQKSSNTKIELGATWLWRYNEALLKVCTELNISLFEQNMIGDALYEANSDQPQRFQIPKNQETSYRIVGGTAALLEKLSNNFSSEELLVNQKVCAISTEGASIHVKTKNNTFKAAFVVSTIPPQLLVNTIQFSEKLPNQLLQIANQTHTWMKDSIKFAVVYKTPFWREKGLSGVGFSAIGPFTELYDHSNFKNSRFALMGFLNGNLANETKAFREEKVKKQLYTFFKDEGKNYISYEEKVWQNDPLVQFTNTQFIPPHFNNGHTIYKTEIFNNRFLIAGSETSSKYGGYMEGAIVRGNEIVAQLKEKHL